MFSSSRVRKHEQALQLWREAEGVVAARWATFLHAEAEGHRWAFASYAAALDAEEVAAANLAALARAGEIGLGGYELRAA